MHPKLFAQFYPTYEYQPADCPCHLLARMPGQARLDARMFMDGVRASAEDMRSVAVRWIEPSSPQQLDELLDIFRKVHATDHWLAETSETVQWMRDKLAERMTSHPDPESNPDLPRTEED
jgi:hypothetical protein